MENVLPVCTSVISILNQSGVTVAVGTTFDGGADILDIDVQADITNVKLNKIKARRNNFK